MHTIVKIFGLLIVLVGVATGVVGLAVSQELAIATVPLLLSSFGIVVSGALFWCFGAIVEHLIAIRANGRQQIALLEMMAGQRSTPDMSKWSAADRERYTLQAPTR